MKEQFRRRHLPHWDVPGATYFVTACLAGSIPAQGLLALRTFSVQLGRRPRPADLSQRDWEGQKWKLLFAQQDQWLDQHPAVRHFEDRRLAAELRSAI